MKRAKPNRNTPDRIVYLLVRENWEPFYVGKGHQKRPNGHIREAITSKNTHKLNIIRKLIQVIGHVPTIVLARDLTDIEACAMEILLIAAIGRTDQNRGPLVNLTNGGDGHSGFIKSDSAKKKLSEALKGRPAHPNTTAAAVKSHLGIPISDETKEKIRKALIGRKFGPRSEEARHNMSVAMTGKKRSPRSEEAKRKTSESLVKNWASGRSVTGMTGKKHSPETLTKMRQAHSFISDETRDRMRAAARMREAKKRGET